MRAPLCVVSIRLYKDVSLHLIPSLLALLLSSNIQSSQCRKLVRYFVVVALVRALSALSMQRDSYDKIITVISGFGRGGAESYVYNK